MAGHKLKPSRALDYYVTTDVMLSASLFSKMQLHFEHTIWILFFLKFVLHIFCTVNQYRVGVNFANETYDSLFTVALPMRCFFLSISVHGMTKAKQKSE